MNAVYGRYKFRKFTRLVGWRLLLKTKQAESSEKGSNTFARPVGCVALVKDVEGRGLLKSPPSRAFDFGCGLSGAGARDDYREVYINETKKTVAFD